MAGEHKMLSTSVLPMCGSPKAVASVGTPILRIPPDFGAPWASGVGAAADAVGLAAGDAATVDGGVEAAGAGFTACGVVVEAAGAGFAVGGAVVEGDVPTQAGNSIADINTSESNKTIQYLFFISLLF